MNDSSHQKVYTSNQIISLIGIIVLTLWAVTILFINLFTPDSLDEIELVFLGTVTILFILLIPLFWMRILSEGALDFRDNAEGAVSYASPCGKT